VLSPPLEYRTVSPPPLLPHATWPPTCVRPLTSLPQGKVGEADLREVRQTFAALDADGSGRLSLADLELVRQQRMLRLSPLLRRRTIRRVIRVGTTRAAQDVGKVLQPGTATLVERWFPHWRTARDSKAS